MRIDKYLWSIRYFKTRSQAAEACKKGHISINNNKVKPSKEVLKSDFIRVRKNQINYEIEVLDIPINRVGAKIVDLFRKDVTPEEAFDHQNLVAYSKSYYRKKGMGRPTKKDRRDIDGFRDDES